MILESTKYKIFTIKVDFEYVPPLVMSKVADFKCAILVVKTTEFNDYQQNYRVYKVYYLIDGIFQVADDIDLQAFDQLFTEEGAKKWEDLEQTVLSL